MRCKTIKEFKTTTLMMMMMTMTVAVTRPDYDDHGVNGITVRHSLTHSFIHFPSFNVNVRRDMSVGRLLVTMCKVGP